jgi:hypothetical protein
VLSSRVRETGSATDRTPYGVSRMVMGIVASIVALAAICFSPPPLQGAEVASLEPRGAAPSDRVLIVPLRLDPSGAPLGKAAAVVVLTNPADAAAWKRAVLEAGDVVGTDTLLVGVTPAGAVASVERILVGYRSSDGRLWFRLAAPTEAGDYALSITGRDRSGAAYFGRALFRMDASSAAAGPVLSATRAIAFPNPFDPSLDGPVTIRWEQTLDASDVLIEIYDFGGDLVARLPVGPMTVDAARTTGAIWHGADEDGKTVADGGYLAHIILHDAGGATSADVKIAVLRR